MSNTPIIRHDDTGTAARVPTPVIPLATARRSIVRALTDGTAPLGLPAALMLERGTLKLYHYEPRDKDLQTPHTQDEIYVVVRGSGTFAMGASEDRLERRPFGPGDAIFVPAGTIHRFEDFTDDFGTWVMMYGRDGGE